MATLTAFPPTPRIDQSDDATLHRGFRDRALPLSPSALQQVADQLAVGLPALWAVLKVETSGCGFLPDRRPKILFERHCFHKLTRGRFDTVAPGVSDPTPGGYGTAGEHQYTRLERAMALDRDAALQSTSWGLGQVMGFNAQAVGFGSADALALACAESEDRQVAAMAAFIRHQRLDRYLKRADWASFARGYNGPAFARNQYDVKLRDWHRRFEAEGTPDLEVRSLQLALHLAGLDPSNPVDGDMGPRTRKLLVLFQLRERLAGSGEPDPVTLGRLKQAAGWY
jgi:hypothetical protein